MIGPRMTALVEDVEWLLEVGESPVQIAARLGVQLKSLDRMLIRVGRNDLAARVRRDKP